MQEKLSLSLLATVQVPSRVLTADLVEKLALSDMGGHRGSHVG